MAGGTPPPARMQGQPPSARRTVKQRDKGTQGWGTKRDRGLSREPISETKSSIQGKRGPQQNLGVGLLTSQARSGVGVVPRVRGSLRWSDVLQKSPWPSQQGRGTSVAGRRRRVGVRKHTSDLKYLLISTANLYLFERKALVILFFLL